MNRFILSALMLLVCILLNAQVPQGFNYQAMARDETGQPIVNAAIPVRLTIQSDSLGGTIFWQELHSEVTTNDIGLFTLIVGKGVKQAGEAATFDAIDWTITPKFIRIEADYEGWQDMGSSRLWAVPYSMVAKDLSGSVNKLTVEGETTDMEESLFEVKNKNGQTVFAVYNEGVRIYVDDGDAKGLKGGFAIGGLNTAKDAPQDLFIVSPDSIRAYIYDDPLTKPLKGGFAIGGFNSAKGITNDYLLVSPDSIRAYIDTDPAKALKGGFAIGGINSAKAVTEEFLRVTRDSTRIYINDIPAKGLKGGFAIGGINTAKGNSRYFDVAIDTMDVINPSQNRINWYPVKNAFLTGRILIEAPDSVGENSFASGYESKSIGRWSQALGYKAIARGDYSTAIGKNALSDGSTSFAFGDEASAAGEFSFSFGDSTIASGIHSVAIGKYTVASENNAFALGVGAKALTENAFAIGSGAEASGLQSIAFGSVWIDESGIPLLTGTRATGDWSLALGYSAEATHISSLSIGSHTSASGLLSMGIGQTAQASNHLADAIGGFSKANGVNSLAIQGEAATDYSISIGYPSKASGNGAIAIGGYSDLKMYFNFLGFNVLVPATKIATASNKGSIAIGSDVTASGEFSVAIGRKMTASNRNSIAIGTGDDTFTPNTGIASGECSTVIGPYGYASGNYASSMSPYSFATSYHSFVVGRWNVTGGSSTSWVDTDPLFIIGNGSSVLSKSNAVTVLKNGNVGIGITSPSQRLHVGGNTVTTGELRQGNSDYGTYEIQTGGRIYSNDYLIAMGGIHVGSSADPGTDNLIVDGNLGIGAPGYGGGSKVIAIENGTVPTSSILSSILLYAENVFHSPIGYWSELKVRDGLGAVTTLSPHNFSLTEISEPMAWSFYSENHSIGQKINVDMLKAIRLIEQLSGEKLVYIEDFEGNPVEYINLDCQEKKTLDIKNREDIFITVQEQQKTIQEKDQRIKSLEERLNRIEALLELENSR